MIEATIKPVEILLVEDNPGDVFLTKNAFSETKIKNNISVAKDGEEAMDYLHKRNGFENAITPDLLLLDLNMPKKDGREVLEEIKADEVLRHIPVVIMTNLDSRPAEILLVEDNEGDALLTKTAFQEAKICNNISVARDGDEALNYLYKRENFKDAKTPDLILLDLNIPKTDGQEVLEKIKRDENLKRIPVVVLPPKK
jgi:CheY-like chemotaxis protein